jgi:tetratricopeptide (TPR) repeat protein
MNVKTVKRKKVKRPHDRTPLPRYSRALLLYVLLAAAILVAYARVQRFDFVNYDDADYVTDNPHVSKGLSAANIAWVFTNSRAGLWIPITSLSQMLDSQLYGQQAGGHHMTSVLLHTLSTLMLFGLLRRTTGSTWRSFFVAFVFGLHPLRVESVAWIAERKDVLGTFFWIVTLWSYVYYVQRPSRRRYLLVTLSLTLGLLSKPIVVTLPFALLLLDLWPLKRISLTGVKTADVLRLVREKLPFFALSAISCVVTYIVAQRLGAVQSLHSISFGTRLGNAAVSYVTYLIQLIYPANLAVIYPYPPPPSWQTAADVTIILVISFLVLRSPDRPYLFVGWFWFLGTLVPVIGIVQAGFQSHADRYTYLPTIGISIILAWGLTDFAQRWPRGPATLAAVGICFCTGWSIATWKQVAYWKNGESLFRHAIAVTTGNFIAHAGLGEALMEEGRIQEAVPEFVESIRLNSTFDAELNFGVLLDQMGRTQEAAIHYRQAVELKPDNATAHAYLGSVLLALGQTDEGLRQWFSAVKLDPVHADLHYNLGTALSSQGRTDEAIQELSQAVRLQPSDPRYHNNLGTAFASGGRMKEALDEFGTALRLDPTYANAEVNLGRALIHLERYDEAKVHLSEALRLDPNLENARDALASLP